MVKASLKKVFIKNFKSLHDCEIDIGKMNVAVGANASGKSNLIEAFRLLKKIYVEKDINPFSEWWGYNNVVWQRKEELSITIGLLFDIEGYDVYYETTCTGIGGKFQILWEVLDIIDFVKIKKEGEWITIKHNLNFVNSVVEELTEEKSLRGVKTTIKKVEQLKKERKYWMSSEQRLIEYYSMPVPSSWQHIAKYILYSTALRAQKDDKIGKFVYILLPAIEYNKQINENLSSYRLNLPFSELACETIFSFIKKYSILYPLNIRSMKTPQTFRREETLKEDGTNIASVYHTIYLKEGKIPEEIYNPLSMVFPKIDVRPHLTDDGRVMIKFFEDGLELLPPNTSDGFYKILTVLIAIYLKPPLLIIDEIENSLHPETLELILDTIGIGETQAIITTHSPVVVDMTELSNIILVEKEHGESKFKRIKDPEKIKDFLIEKGITFSEGWIYGDLFKTEKQA
jgi:predicted ATPase